ncbi:UDP-N-acetyl glucosamine 2-epimerase [Fluviibacter phosphoraccumulans]|uniref:UDP-N-acetylglucosamine 2-epimerase (non-hydrolyzing) n=3 Tax=Fluviibacter phosphoraccumulans TaxID=1751046 RepID=A0A7R6QYM4_9RHOO|nr:UDP-N-acetyl glucosamine 2-epimerase [Fluviibacter phosphoraccumulans]BBU71206.1 UDP-N-acetyl glucosamine 2-epimerase [Fluviibacter phosphoraccumulans]
MLNAVLGFFAVHPDVSLDVMQPNQSLNSLFSRVLEAADKTLQACQPDVVLVHGDTTTAAACALAAFHRGIAVGHVEAGLRTGDLQQPFPEELNRRLIDEVAGYLFAPTESAKVNLETDCAAGYIIVTGNTVIDSLAETAQRIKNSSALNDALASGFSFIQPDRQMVLVTGHRRENFGEGFEQICDALIEIAEKSNAQIVYPVHLNPAVRATVLSRLQGYDQIHLIEPVNYAEFVWLMMRSDLILTDSGGVQEEAPFLGKPVLVMRNVTERPEALTTGLVELVGTDAQRIAAAAMARLTSSKSCSVSEPMSPYGDGNAAQRIVDALLGRQVAEFKA